MAEAAAASPRKSRFSKRRRDDDVLGGEYAVVAFRPSWGILSLVCFLATLTVEEWIHWLPWEPENTPQLIYWRVLGLGATSSAGLLLAVLERFFGERSGLAKWALILNGFSFFLVALTFLVMRLVIFG